MTATDPVTIALTGKLPFILIFSGVLGLLLSFLLLWLYRRAVLRGMARRKAETAPEVAPATRTVPAPPPKPLRIRYTATADGKEEAGGGELSRRACSSPWRAAAVYGAGGTVFAIVMETSVLQATDMEVLPLRFLLLVWVYLWPLVLTVTLVAAVTRRTKVLLAAAYGIGYAILVTAILLASPTGTLGQLVVLWFSINLPASLLFMVFLLRPVRAVGPLVVTFLVFAATGSMVFLTLLEQSEAALRTVSDLFFSLGVGAAGVLTTVIVAGFIVFALLGGFVLQLMRRAYLAKLVNDQSLILDSIWLLFGISYSIELTFEGVAWASAGLVAFAAYLITVRLGFRFASGGSRTSNTPLLVLRVFSLGKRSEALFEAISRHWRYLGSVHLIAGPDLAAATVEPHEFLDFVSGRLERQFIDGPEALTRRLAALDNVPDFDGRFRVNDFFCHDDTWQATLAALVSHSELVFMDLRGFTAVQKGCAYELRQLLQFVPLARIVLLVDTATDRNFLEQTLADAWNGLPGDASNRLVAEPQLTIVEGAVGSDKFLTHLLASLCRAATA